MDFVLGLFGYPAQPAAQPAAASQPAPGEPSAAAPAPEAAPQSEPEPQPLPAGAVVPPAEPLPASDSPNQTAASASAGAVAPYAVAALEPAESVQPAAEVGPTVEVARPSLRREEVGALRHVASDPAVSALLHAEDERGVAPADKPVREAGTPRPPRAAVATGVPELVVGPTGAGVTTGLGGAWWSGSIWPPRAQDWARAAEARERAELQCEHKARPLFAWRGGRVERVPDETVETAVGISGAEQQGVATELRSLSAVDRGVVTVEDVPALPGDDGESEPAPPAPLTLPPLDDVPPPPPSDLEEAASSAGSSACVSAVGGASLSSSGCYPRTGWSDADLREMERRWAADCRRDGREWASEACRPCTAPATREPPAPTSEEPQQPPADRAPEEPQQPPADREPAPPSGRSARAAAGIRMAACLAELRESEAGRLRAANARLVDRVRALEERNDELCAERDRLSLRVATLPALAALCIREAAGEAKASVMVPPPPPAPGARRAAERESGPAREALAELAEARRAELARCASDLAALRSQHAALERKAAHTERLLEQLKAKHERRGARFARVHDQLTEAAIVSQAAAARLRAENRRQRKDARAERRQVRNAARRAARDPAPPALARASSCNPTEHEEDEDAQAQADALADALDAL